MTQELTNRQKTFARHIVEGIYSNAECARKAGYSPDQAKDYASRLLNGRDYPHVLVYIKFVSGHAVPNLLPRIVGTRSFFLKLGAVSA